MTHSFICRNDTRFFFFCFDLPSWCFPNLLRNTNQCVWTGTILDDLGGKKCVPRDSCPCMFQGKVYSSGGTYSTPCQNWYCCELDCTNKIEAVIGEHQLVAFCSLTLFTVPNVLSNHGINEKTGIWIATAFGKTLRQPSTTHCYHLHLELPESIKPGIPKGRKMRLFAY